jgi:hypothetical protein
MEDVREGELCTHEVGPCQAPVWDALQPPFSWPLNASARSRGQGGAPAAQRGRTTLAPARTGAH